MVRKGEAKTPREPFLRSKSGRAWILLLGLALLSSAAAGGALYRSNIHWFETNKLEETATALRLVEAMVANYTDVRADLLGEKAPVPAAFRAHAIERFNAARDGDHQIYLDWLGVPGREIARAPQDNRKSNCTNVLIPAASINSAVSNPGIRNTVSNAYFMLQDSQEQAAP